METWLEILIKKLAKKINKKMKGVSAENEHLIDQATTYLEDTLMSKMDNLTNFKKTIYKFSMEDLFKEPLTGLHSY